MSRDSELRELTAAPGMREIFLGFLEIALSGFGGVLPWARRVMVERRRWLSADDFTDVLSLCQFLPGPNIVNMSVAVGARFHGAAGAMVAVTGLLAAPVAIIIAVGALYSGYGHVGWVQGMIRGISAVACGLLVATGIKMLVAPRSRSWTLVFGVAAFAGVAVFRLPLVGVLLVVAPISVAAAWRRLRR
jgi:chromate transporter